MIEEFEIPARWSPQSEEPTADAQGALCTRCSIQSIARLSWCSIFAASSQVSCRSFKKTMQSSSLRMPTLIMRPSLSGTHMRLAHPHVAQALAHACIW